MKGALVLTLAMLALINTKPPTEVIVYENISCKFNTKFNTHDVKAILTNPDAKEIINLKINPTSHLIETKVNPFVSTFSHRNGNEYLDKIAAYECAKNIYSVEKANGLLVLLSEVNGSVVDFIRNTHGDNGKVLLECMFSDDSQVYIRTDRLDFEKNFKAIATPYLLLDGKLYMYDGLSSLLEIICKYRGYDGTACSGIRKTLVELSAYNDERRIARKPEIIDNIDEKLYEFVDEEVAAPVEENKVDYEAFWNSSDEEVAAPVEENKVDYEAFWNSSDKEVAAPVEEPKVDYASFWNTPDDE
jgi:hypothetical protein